MCLFCVEVESKVEKLHVITAQLDIILHYNYDTKLHIHDNFLSLFEDNNILYTYDLDNEKFLLFDKKIYFVKSFYFLNNSLVVLENNNFLTSYNLINNKIFWKVDLSKILSNCYSICIPHFYNVLKIADAKNLR